MKKKLIILLLSLHLLLLYAGSSLFDFGHVPAMLQGPVAYYLALVGGHDYSFFSPDIPPQIVVRCYTTDQNGHQYIDTIQRSTNSFELRSVYLFQILSDNSGMEAAAKIAADNAAGIHVHTRSVRVSIGRFEVPTIEQYKIGKMYGFTELYTQSFKYE